MTISGCFTLLAQRWNKLWWWERHHEQMLSVRRSLYENIALSWTQLLWLWGRGIRELWSVLAR